MYPYLFTKNGERLPHSSMHARNLAMRQQALCCRPLLLYRKSTSKTYPHPLRKNGERLPIVACIIVAEIRLLLLGNFETKARNLGMRPKGCCRPMLLFWKSFVVNDSFLTLSVHLVLYLFVLTLHVYHSFSYL